VRCFLAVLASFEMAHEFIPRKDEPEAEPHEQGRESSPRLGLPPEVMDYGEPNPAPKALMRKRLGIWFWILLALALGGFIALAMVVMSQ
jgi:hypothetical protein